jgi:hypothetical protein
VQIWPEPAAPEFADPLAAGAHLHPSSAALLAHWQAISPQGRLPGRQHFEPMAVPQLLPNLWLLDVVDGGMDFRVRVTGTAIEEAGAWAQTGARISEVFPPAESGALLHELRRVVRTGRPLWQQHGRHMTQTGALASVERLAVPLAADGVQVDMVLGLSVFGWECARPALRVVGRTTRD